MGAWETDSAEGDNDGELDLRLPFDVLRFMGLESQARITRRRRGRDKGVTPDVKNLVRSTTMSTLQ